MQRITLWPLLRFALIGAFLSAGCSMGPWDPDVTWRIERPGGPPRFRDFSPGEHLIWWAGVRGPGSGRFEFILDKGEEYFGTGDESLLRLVEELRAMRPTRVRIEYFSREFPSSLGPDPDLPFPVSPETLAIVRAAFKEMGCEIILYDWAATGEPH